MSVIRGLVLLTSALAACPLSACGSDGRGDGDEGVPDSGADSDADGDTDPDTSFESCLKEGIWYDPDANLCWQNPAPVQFFVLGDAVDYCSSLDLGGFQDWRLPEVQELISALRGCVNGVATGDLSTSACGVSDPDCLSEACNDFTCDQCEVYAGPDEEGCYWDPEVIGGCNYFWSSSQVGEEETRHWTVSFGSGRVWYEGYQYPNYAAWCVRDGP